MKKMASIATLIAIFCGSFSTLYAQENMIYKKSPEVLNIQKVKEEARSYIRGEENYQKKKEQLKKLEEEYERNYGGRMVLFDKTGNEVVKYLYNDEIKIDPVGSLKTLEEQLEELRVMNQDLATDAFFQLLLQRNKVGIAKTNMELADFGKEISQLSYELGKVISVNAENSEVTKRGAALGVKEEELALTREYEDLNKLLGYSPQARYQLDYDSVISKMDRGVDILYVPSNMNEESLAKLKSLSEQKKILDRKQEAQDRLEKSWERGKEKEDIEEIINLKELKETYEKSRKDVKTGLEKSYLDGMSSFLNLDQSKKELEQQSQEYKNQTLKYNLGKISKLEYLSAQAKFFSDEKRYLDTVYALYQEVDRYERLYREKK